ncbi:MAG: cysteine--tRNA ligase [Planktomarina sp.]|jgi:cysteinyl-tRNA synthetase|nr:cysteine--tRNA ligase [Planktomarina sp.]|tara:strand:- start:6734 stop:8095 length:1362 start_codon:yes stop_codon:yes gene_type:complete
MTKIMLHNTKSRRKEDFIPLDLSNVRMYVCGPTVYDRAHIGNARAVVVFDSLFRLLREVYGPDYVTYARNFTDIDDKINARAAATGRNISELTEETIAWYLDDMASLAALEPNVMPRATDYISQMITMTECLITKGHAYNAEGHVLFDVKSCPDYGSLSGRSIDDMIAGARVEVAPYKRDPMDFVLWKPSDSDTPGWDSPWGRGRPGWHIECSAMVHEHFGDSFDIHGGGNDLMFPHHENEIAQSSCAHPDGAFAQVWMHNEMLQVEGKKMSKSLGNFFTVQDLLQQNISGEVIRFVLLSTHYGKPMDWTQKKADDAAATLRKWHKLVKNARPAALDGAVLGHVANDLNTPGALARMHELVKAGDADAVLAAGQFLGLLAADADWWKPKQASDNVKVRIEALLTDRSQAKADRNFAKADAVRAQLEAAGIEVVDKPGGLSEAVITEAFDPDLL